MSEIKKVARRDPVLAAEGAVMLLERVSPALEGVDSSSGAIGTAVNHAIEELVAIIAKAPADAKTREGWLERLWEAHANDEIPYIERLGDFWGELCASREIVSAWADRLVRIVEMAWSPDPELRGFFHGSGSGRSWRARRSASAYPSGTRSGEPGIACRSAAPRDRSGEELAVFRRAGDPALRVDRRLAFEEWFR